MNLDDLKLVNSLEELEMALNIENLEERLEMVQLMVLTGDIEGGDSKALEEAHNGCCKNTSCCGGKGKAEDFNVEDLEIIFK